jgi:septum formation protein
MSNFVLASGSQIRRSILEGAGVRFDVRKSSVDEDKIKIDRVELSPSEMAVLLAEAKAVSVSREHPEALVLGADQTMELDGKLLDKLPNRQLARTRLTAMRGKHHQLHSGLILAMNGDVVWTHQQTSNLFVREFSDAFLESYLLEAGDELTASVGAYAYEGLGAQLFERVDADYYAVLGLPLLPLLEALREFGVAPR